MLGLDIADSASIILVAMEHKFNKELHWPQDHQGLLYKVTIS